MLAATEVNGSILLGSVGSGGKFRSLVGAIAEGLRGALTAGAPIVGLACLDSDRDRGFLGDGGFGHKSDGWGFLGIEFLLNAINHLIALPAKAMQYFLNTYYQ